MILPQVTLRIYDDFADHLFYYTMNFMDAATAAKQAIYEDPRDNPWMNQSNDDGVSYHAVFPDDEPVPEAIQSPEGVQPCTTRDEVMVKIRDLMPSVRYCCGHSKAIALMNTQFADTDFLLLTPMMRAIIHYCALDVGCKRIINIMAWIPEAHDQTNLTVRAPFRLHFTSTAQGQELRYLAWMMEVDYSELKPKSHLGKLSMKRIKQIQILATINEIEQHGAAVDIRSRAIEYEDIVLNIWNSVIGVDEYYIGQCRIIINMLRKIINDPFDDVEDLLISLAETREAMRELGVSNV